MVAENKSEIFLVIQYMIPKIIHYTWFSGDPFPKRIQECIDSWRKFMPEYELVLWDAERLKEIDSIWLKECLDKKKWAFAADFVRLYAIYKYGGIYLDTDCVVYRSFDTLLNDTCFIGKENSIHVEGRSTEQYLTSHCFGAEKNNPFIEQCLAYYENRHFVLSQSEKLPMKLKYSTLLLPFIQSEIAKQLGYNPNPSAKNLQKLDDVSVYPSNYFDVVKLNSDSFCKHLALGGWRDSRTPEDEITLAYKIKWRIEAVARWFVGLFDYMLIKKR